MMYKTKYAVCSEIPTTQIEHHVEILMLNLVVWKETAKICPSVSLFHCAFSFTIFICSNK
jgi:hypothetical protein